MSPRFWPVLVNGQWHHQSGWGHGKNRSNDDEFAVSLPHPGTAVQWVLVNIGLDSEGQFWPGEFNSQAVGICSALGILKRIAILNPCFIPASKKVNKKEEK